MNLLQLVLKDPPCTGKCSQTLLSFEEGLEYLSEEEEEGFSGMGQKLESQGTLGGDRSV